MKISKENLIKFTDENLNEEISFNKIMIKENTISNEKKKYI